MKKTISVKWAVGFCIFTALSALSFQFNTGEVSFLVDSSNNWIVYLLSMFALIVVILFRSQFSKNELFGLSALYATVPFAFYVNHALGQDITLFWQKDLWVSLCFWLIAAILLSRFLIPRKSVN